MRLLFFFLLSVGLANGQGIIVRGNWKDADRKEISLLFLEDATIYKSTFIISKVDSLNGSFYFSVPSSHPTKLQLLNQYFLALPNDTITILIEKNAEGVEILNFLDPQEKESSFFPLLKRELKPFAVRDFPFEKPASIELYKNEAVAHYNVVLNFLQTHSSHYSADGKSLIKDLVTIEYYKDLLYPLSSRKILKAQLPSNYFEEMDISLLSRIDLLSFREYILLLSDFNECFYGSPSPKGKYYDSAYVDNRIVSAYANFAGKVKNNLLLLIYDGLVENGSAKNEAQFDKLYNYLSNAFKSEPFRIEKINELKFQFDLLGKPFPKNILAQQLRSQEGGSVALSKALSSDKIKYIDFWASWCKPCMEEMPREQQLISEFKDNGVELIFISLDKDEEAWKKALKKINIKEYHFRLPEGIKSELIRYLNFDGIPRYVVIDKNGVLLSYDAPRPSFVLKDKFKLMSLLK